MAVANCVVEQFPAFSSFPVGQDVIYVVSNNDAVANQLKVKFVAEVHIGTTQPNLSTVTDIIGTFKTTPNNAGVGIFNLRSVLENYVKADHIASSNALFGGSTSLVDLPVHLIDQFSKSTNIIRFLGIQFKVEYYDALTENIIVGGAVNSEGFKFWNGYLKYSDIISVDVDHTSSAYLSFGFNSGIFIPFDTTRRYLTNAPTTQYANVEDYGTLAFLVLSSSSFASTNKFKITGYTAAGSAVSGSALTRTQQTSTGSWDSWTVEAEKLITYVGVFPANLQGSWWNTAIGNGMTHYKVQAQSSSGTAKLETITIYINCPTTQGYESVRLCWLNQWGAWDYYTFTQKSIRTISTQGSTYTQLNGSWNEANYRYANQQGGKKTFRRNATEKVTINTDFVTENYNVMFEELMNSPEVYILQGTQASTSSGNYSYELSQYVTPTRILNSSFVKKTKANDQLIQYTFEVEKSKTLRTQSI
tara:strand:+ start:80 stop:1501 length:1422 start_codon:yes stop_codon:yes gene_type:complete